MKHRKKHIWASIMILLIVAFDQVTKRLAESALMGGKIVTLLPGAVQLRYARNTGMAFSLFSGARWVFVALTALVCAGVLFYMFRNKCRSLWGYWSLGVLVAGGLGNLIDRVLYGYVIDFIEPTFMQFAVFNIADCAVTCGGISFVLWLAVDLFRSGDGKKGTTHDGNERQPVRAFTVDETAAGERLDKFLSTVCPDLTRSAAARVIEEGGVLLDGAPGNKKDKLRPGTRVELRLPEPKPMEVLPEHIPLDVVYEDGDLLVVNKPKGMVVHPAPGNYTGTLVNALLYYCGDSLSGVGGVIRPGIVHRIDKDTSGLLMVAKNDFAHVDLARQIQEHSFHRAYQAVVYGNVTADSGTVCQPIGRSPKDRKKMAVTQQNSKPATTHYRVLERFGDFTHIRCVLETGRTHQIRVHMAYIGHPLAGDPVYGPRRVITSLGGQCLHAGEIGFIHPRTGAEMRFEAPLPPYFTSFLHTCREKKR